LATTRTKLHFARFEFKYILPRELRDDVESELKFFLEFDPFVVSRPHHQYFVRSLYYDDPALTCFYDKHDGLHTRSKFRVRTYTDNPDDNTPYFLEIKGRHNNLVFKHRAKVEVGPGEMHVRGRDLAHHLLRHIPDCSVRTQFEYELYRKRLRPVALVDYFRRPYISKYDPQFRLTFDDHLRGTTTDGLFPVNGERQRSLLLGFTVVEVKFRRVIPSWFHRIIQCYDLRRIACSKICRAMEGLEIAGDPS